MAVTAVDEAGNPATSMAKGGLIVDILENVARFTKYLSGPIAGIITGGSMVWA